MSREIQRRLIFESILKQLRSLRDIPIALQLNYSHLKSPTTNMFLDPQSDQ